MEAVVASRERTKTQTKILGLGGGGVKLHVRARFFRFARKFNNSDICMAAPYVQVPTKRRLRCPDQPDPRPDPNPNPNPKTLTLTLTQPFGGLEVCPRGRQGQY